MLSPACIFSAPPSSSRRSLACAIFTTALCSYVVRVRLAPLPRPDSHRRERDHRRRLTQEQQRADRRVVPPSSSLVSWLPARLSQWLCGLASRTARSICAAQWPAMHSSTLRGPFPTLLGSQTTQALSTRRMLLISRTPSADQADYFSHFHYVLIIIFSHGPNHEV